MDKAELVKRYVDLCYRFLSIRNRSIQEIRDYLRKKKADDDVIEIIVAKLIDQKLLDDETFARGWVRARARLKPRGRALLAIELRQKGIDPDIIATVLHEADSDIPSEADQAKELIKTRMERFAGLPRQAIYQKVGAFLMRKGYSWDTAKKAIDSYLS